MASDGSRVLNRTTYSAISRSSEDNHQRDGQSQRRVLVGSRRLLVLISAGILFLVSILLLSPAQTHHSPHDELFILKDQDSSFTVVSPGISDDAFKYGLDKCSKIQEKQEKPAAKSERTKNPRFVEGTPAILIRKGTVWTGDAYVEADVFLSDGLIQKIGEDIEVPDGTKIIDAQGHIITPGLIDMHSHAGLMSFPYSSATMDVGEQSAPTVPQVRAIDAFNPSDPAIRIIASGGVTSSLILPGSGNLMGGEAIAIKMRRPATLSVEDMQIQSGVDGEEKVWRYMKMACGENPKNWFGRLQGTAPFTRLGEGYHFRKRFFEAQQLKHAQDDWCDAASTIANGPPNANIRLGTRFPEYLENESLVALLRGDVNLNVHCYEPVDIESFVRFSLEFDFPIAAFHHALQAWKIPDIIKRAKTNITIATFSNMWGYKWEAFDANVNAPQILTEAGIPVALKTDHPILNARDLSWEAGKSHHFGFDEHLALSAVTSVPANSMGLGHRIGKLAAGYDADVVIWTGHPLRLGSRPRQVIIDGIEQFDDAGANTTPPSTKLPEAPVDTMTVEETAPGTACSSHTSTFVVRNIKVLFMDKDTTYRADKIKKDEEIAIVVKHGVVKCVGVKCLKKDWDGPVFNTHGGYVLPGLISAGARIGLSEIEQEPSTIDGFAFNNVLDPSLAKNAIRAVDGLKLGSMHLKKPFKAGVLTSITQPVSFGFFHGVSVAFKTGGRNTVVDGDVVVKDEAALYFEIGVTVTDNNVPTVSSRIAKLRELLIDNIDSSSSNIFHRAVRGRLPIIVNTQSKDEIASIIILKRHIATITKHSGPKFIILGGTESWLLAKELANAKIPVILRSPRCMPNMWAAQHCLLGPPLVNVTAIDVLLEHGVQVGLSNLEEDDGYVRDIIWDAGWNLATNPSFTESKAVGLVSWNIADMFDLDSGVIRKDEDAEFVVYSGNPLKAAGKVQLIVGGGRSGTTCFPEQI